LAKSVIAQLVGNTVVKGRCSSWTDIKITITAQKISLVGHVVGVNATADAHWPQKLVNVIRRVAWKVQRFFVKFKRYWSERTKDEN